MSRKPAYHPKSVGGDPACSERRHSRRCAVLGGAERSRCGYAVGAEGGTLTRVPYPTRRAARGAEREHRNPAGRCGAVGPAGPPSCGEAVAVVTARRAGTRSWKPRTASTRHIDTPAQSGDRRESERSERPDEQDCRAGAMAQRARLMRCGGRSR